MPYNQRSVLLPPPIKSLVWFPSSVINASHILKDHTVVLLDDRYLELNICHLLLHNTGSVLLPLFGKNQNRVFPPRCCPPPVVVFSCSKKIKWNQRQNVTREAVSPRAGVNSRGSKKCLEHRVTEWCVKCFSGTLSTMTAWWRESVWARVDMYNSFKVERSPRGHLVPRVPLLYLYISLASSRSLSEPHMTLRK